jgi:hypothetical protein
MASKRVSEKKMVAPSGAAQSASVRKQATSKRTTRSAKPVETLATPAAQPETTAPFGVEPLGAPAHSLAIAHQVEEPSQEAVAALAYSYWVARDCQGGSSEEDWLRAEQELRTVCSSAACATA